MQALANIALLMKYLPQVLTLVTTIKSIHDALPPAATLQDKVAAVETAITAAHAVAVADGATTATFDEFYAPISGLVNLVVSKLHG